MDIIKHAEIKPKPPRTIFGRLKAYFSKKAVLLSTIAALSGGCGGVPSANLPSGAQGDVPGQSLPAAYSSGLADERHMTIAMSLVGADRRAFRCDQSNEVKFKSVELWNERYEGAEIDEGKCVTIEGVRTTYSVYLDEIRVSGGLYRDHSLLIADQNSPVQHFLLGRGKYLRLGNDASIYMLYDKSKEITYMLLHRQRKVSEVNMEFENFKATNTPDAYFIKPYFSEQT